MSRERAFSLATAVGATLFVAATCLAPLRWAYAPLCHQMPERSLWIGDHPQAVCARCAGLYLGGALGLWLAAGGFAWTWLRPRPGWLLAAALPTLIDFTFGWVGLPQLPNTWRLVVTLPAGLVAGLFLAIGVADIARATLRERAHG
jgi:uncharacterized membrane protein